jgi:hypothetical protein
MIYLPETQSAQSSGFSRPVVVSAVYVPLGQSRGVAEPTGQYEYAGQSTGMLVFCGQ